MTKELPVHPAAAVWPVMPEQIDALTADIAANGLHNPLIRWTDKNGVTWLLDGRMRFEACRRAGVEPTWENYPDDDPVGFVLSMNAHRRHLSPSQLAMAEAYTVTSIQGRPNKEANLPLNRVDDAAARASVSPRLIKSALYVRDHAPDLAEAVLAGTIRVTAAESEARRRQAKAEEEQRRLAEVRAADLDLAEQIEAGELTLADAETYRDADIVNASEIVDGIHRNLSALNLQLDSDLLSVSPIPLDAPLMRVVAKQLEEVADAAVP